MRLPAWVTFVLAGLIVLFGIYRLRIGLIPADRYAEMRDRGSMYRLGRRNHIMVGIVYVLLGGWLIASALGYGGGP